MKKLKESTVWIIIWILMYLAGFFTNVSDIFSNRGIHIINGQYYRFFTGLLLHTGLIHILGNILGIYFTGKFLDHQISQWKLLLITVFSATSANAIFSVIAPNSISVGGSPIVFSLIGLVCVSQFLCKDTPRFTPILNCLPFGIHWNQMQTFKIQIESHSGDSISFYSSTVFNSNVKQLPFPSSLSTRTFPPCACAIHFAMESPRPECEPSSFPVREASTR